MKDLRLMIKHINGIETLIIDDFDIFFDAQIYLPNLKHMFIENCKINKNNLQLYSNIYIMTYDYYYGYLYRNIHILLATIINILLLLCFCSLILCFL